MFSPSRDQARQFFFDAWRKHRASEPAEGLERLAIAVMLLHPEYHGVLDAPERHRDRDYLPEIGQINPFLHLSLHLAIAEQIAIDQPRGIRAASEALQRRTGSAHDAAHALLDCLAQAIWQAQRDRRPIDETAYRRAILQRAGIDG